MSKSAIRCGVATAQRAVMAERKKRAFPDREGLFTYRAWLVSEVDGYRENLLRIAPPRPRTPEPSRTSDEGSGVAALAVLTETSSRLI